MSKHAIVLGGAVGVGKTTLGRGLAGRLPGGFINGDEFSDPGRPWYYSVLQTSRGMVRAGLSALETTSAVVVAYPVNCIN